MTHAHLTSASESKQNSSIGLIAKWLPREKSKRFGWVFKLIAERMFIDIIKEPKNGWKSLSQKTKAENSLCILYTFMS